MEQYMGAYEKASGRLVYMTPVKGSFARMMPKYSPLKYEYRRVV